MCNHRVDNCIDKIPTKSALHHQSWSLHTWLPINFSMDHTLHTYVSLYKFSFLKIPLSSLRPDPSKTTTSRASLWRTAIKMLNIVPMDQTSSPSTLKESSGSDNVLAWSFASYVTLGSSFTYRPLSCKIEVLMCSTNVKMKGNLLLWESKGACHTSTSSQDQSTNFSQFHCFSF